MQSLVETLGFRGNPFAQYTAENEPDIDKYFVRPPFFTTIRERALDARSFILFGARGYGKSATRLALYKEMWGRVEKGEQAPLCVTVDDYSHVLRGGLGQAQLGGFVVEICYSAIEAILLWLSTLDEGAREARIRGLGEDPMRALVTFVDRYYLGRPAPTRQVSAKNAMRLLDQAWTDRAALWAQKKWSSIATLMGVIAELITTKWGNTEVDIDQPLARLVEQADTDWDDSQYSAAVLTRMSELAVALGFTGVVALVDKVDETELTSNSAEDTARLLFPILSQTKLLEIAGFGWVFFLWDQVNDHYGAGNLKVRLDKIANAQISWGDKYLKDLVAERIWFYSNERTRDFGVLCESADVANDCLEQSLELAGKSPRELVRILDTVIRTHDERDRADDDERISETDLQEALDRYAVERAKQLYTTEILRQVLSLGMTTFTNKDVGRKFRIGPGPARNRILKWSDAGVARRAGSTAGDGTHGKPAHQYTVIDTRVARIIKRRLDSGFDLDELDNGQEALEFSSDG